MKKSVKILRKKRIRESIKGRSGLPRLSVFRSNKFVYAQIIDDAKGKTLISASEKEMGLKDKKNKSERSRELGIFIAKKAIAKKIHEVVFDRGSYRYHGRVKAIAEGARQGGLKF